MAREILTPEERKRRNKEVWQKRFRESAKGKAYRTAYYSANKEQIRATHKAYDQTPAGKAAQKAAQKRYMQTDEFKARRKLYRKLPKVREAEQNYRRQYFQRPDVKERRRLQAAQRRASPIGINYRDLSAQQYVKLRNDTLKVLGDVCCRCGFSDKRALQIDHINGGGKYDRRPLVTRYRQIINDATDDFQLLCANCNWIKRVENGEHRQRKQ